MIEVAGCEKMSGCCQSKGLDLNRIAPVVQDHSRLLFMYLGQSRRSNARDINNTNLHLDR